MKRILTIALFTCFSGFAFAAQSLNYVVPVGTVTHYKTASLNKTSFSNAVVSNTDGSPVPRSTQDAFLAAFTNFESTTNSDFVETVREVLTDGTRVVDATNTATVTSKTATFSIPTQTLKYSSVTAYKPDGTTQLQDLKYDRNSFPGNTPDAMIDDLENNLKTALSSAKPTVYGQHYELNQPLFFEYRIQNSGFGAIEATINGTRTLKSIGDQGQLEFEVTTTTNAFKTKLELTKLGVTSEYDFPGSTANSSERYLTDGRLEHMKSQSTTNYAFKTSIKILSQDLSITGTGNVTLETSTDLIP